MKKMIIKIMMKKKNKNKLKYYLVKLINNIFI